jgi:two-component system response regulator AtoC
VVSERWLATSLALTAIVLAAGCAISGGMASPLLPLLLAWPGNVRELENTLARLVADSDGGELGPEVLQAATPPPRTRAPAPASSTGTGDPFRVQVAAFERALIQRALDDAGGNRAEAARRLGLSRVTLLDRLKRLGM